MPEQLVEGEHALLAAELAQDKHGRVLLDVVRLRVVDVLLQPFDRLVQAVVDHFGSDGAAGLCEVAQALGSLFDKLTIVDAKLVEQHGNQLVDIVNNLRLARDV